MSVISGRVPMSMPARLALQPNSFRLSLKRGGWSLPRNPLTGHRWYTSQGKAAPKGQSFAYTWLTKTPDEIVSLSLLRRRCLRLTVPLTLPILERYQTMCSQVFRLFQRHLQSQGISPSSSSPPVSLRGSIPPALSLTSV